MIYYSFYYIINYNLQFGSICYHLFHYLQIGFVFFVIYSIYSAAAAGLVTPHRSSTVHLKTG